jgi:flagellar hook-associated protein 3 FlgL
MSVSNIGQSLNEQFLLQRLRNELNGVQTQINTGKKGNTFSALDTAGASNSMSFRNSRNLLQSYIDSINIVRSRTDVMDAALISVTDSSRDVMTRLQSQLQDTVPQTAIIRDEAQAQLEVVLQKLNTRFGDRYLFSGTDINNPPHDNAAGLNANFAAQVNTWITGAPPTIASVVADASGFNDAALGYSGTLSAAGAVTVRADEGTDINYTVLANEEGLRDVVRGLAIVANLQDPTTPAEQDNFWTVVNGAIQLIDEGSRAIDDEIGILGNKSRQMEDLLIQHDESQGALEIFIGQVEDVDLADAVTRFNSLELQLQASYQVTSTVRQLSLVNFI